MKYLTTLFVFLLWCNDIESVVVEIEQGFLRGETKITSTYLGIYYSFKGIPYAAPPVGDLRFRAPQPPLRWNGIRNATEHGSICVQPDSYTNRTARGSEDCLYLNVYSPNLLPDIPLPVMVFIHGGAFTMGSGDSDKYSPDFLMLHNVVLVTFNYRLGALGFLAMNTEDVPGNAGMKDQIAVLQWVQENINKFGGDPNCVTIFGDSSGAAMVTLHVVSPAAKNLFQRAIAMSGSFLNDWSLGFAPVKRAFALGLELGLVTNDTRRLTTFLKSVAPEELILARPNLLKLDVVYNDLLFLTYFTPFIEEKYGNGDGQYLTSDPISLMRNCKINKVDFMMGHTDNEGLHNTAEFEEKILEYFPKFRQILVPLKMVYVPIPKNVFRTNYHRIQHFYFGPEITEENLISKFNNFYTYQRDEFNFYSFMESLPTSSCVHRYFYVFRIYSSRNYYSKLAASKFGIENATHRDDLLYLFDGSSYNLPPVDINSKEFEYIQLMCKMFTNYAKFGNPTPDDSLGAIWPEYEPDVGFMTIERNGTLTPGNVPMFTHTDLNFWRELYLRNGIDPFRSYSYVD